VNKNKITFCTYPDTVMGTPCYALKNYTNKTIKHLLTTVDNDVLYYLLDKDNPKEWLQTVLNQATIIIDCADIPLTQITKLCQKKL